MLTTCVRCKFGKIKKQRYQNISATSFLMNHYHVVIPSLLRHKRAVQGAFNLPLPLQTPSFQPLVSHFCDWFTVLIKLSSNHATD